MTVKTGPTEALQSITDKRRALESLINIACGVENQQAALNELALAARPSQDFPAKLANYFKAMETRTKDEDSTSLLQKLDKIEETIAQSVEQILILANVDVNELRDQEVENLDIDTFQSFIEEFKRRTNTSLGLRYLLNRRGVAIAPIKIPIQQQTLNQKITSLKKKEKACVKQIRSEIQSIIKDTQTILATSNLPEEMEKELRNVNKAMQVNIAHLDSGGNVTDIPNVFECVVLESKSVSEFSVGENKELEPISQPAQNKAEQSTSNDDTPKPSPISKPPEQAKSNWWIFKKWLSSPWSTSWRSLKEKYGGK